jgi:pyruvate,water dikinase
VPDTVVLTAAAYEHFLDRRRLRERIALELGRKPLGEMRWEEVWDTALRIRHLFLSHGVPSELARAIERTVAERFSGTPLAVRSSAPEEDDGRSSFAGLHESFVNVAGLPDVLDRVRQVWASLWSDAALLYRRELGLRVETSTMAVLLQELRAGDRSGVAFSRSPVDRGKAVVEAVHGLNQGLVDGTVEPDRWTLDRATGRLSAQAPAARENAVVPCPGGVRLEPLPSDRAAVPPLVEAEARRVMETAIGLEGEGAGAVDMEWTMDPRGLVLLQVRPVTAGEGAGEDRRPWYLSLRRSFESLQALRRRIEDELIPEMEREGRRLAAVDLGAAGARELAAEIARRWELNGRWSRVYWREFIPMAHGARLFGQVYNDRVKPASPFEFTVLLAGTGLESIRRNRRLAELGRRLAAVPDWEGRWSEGGPAALPPDLAAEIEAFRARYGGLFEPAAPEGGPGAAHWVALFRQFARLAEATPGPKGAAADPAALERRYMESFAPGERDFAAALLDLARASYRLRDDDNIVLGRIEAEGNRALDEAARRLAGTLDPDERRVLEEAVGAARHESPAVGPVVLPERLRARQLIGQPAGAGIARGPARVIDGPGDLYRFEAGDVLVCDAVDPNMTFVVPLAAAVVERRGGMLIHGAIIAREYGIPCVTGVPEATRLIRTGDPLTVDGYLGIVVCERTPPDREDRPPVGGDPWNRKSRSE